MNRVLLSSKKSTYETPDNVLELVRQVHPIGLDPCTSDENPVGAPVFYTSNGLSRDWTIVYRRDDPDPDQVFVNPPYGTGLSKWVAKACDTGLDVPITLLVPARTDTLWFKQLRKTSDAMCFWQGRLTFRGEKDPAPFPSLLAYWGNKPHRFCDVFAPHGWVLLAR